MSKIYFVPDVHLQEYSPRSRKDNYPTVILEKLEYIVEYVNKNNGECVFLGDVFNAVNLPMIYLYRVIDVFKKFNKVPYVIIGNHDVPRNNPDLINRTPLGLMEQAGFIKWLDKLEYDKVVIKGFHYTSPILKADTDKKSICVAHVFYEDNFALDHNLHIKDCLELGYNYYILGHDHTVYDTVKNDKYQVYRIGSLSRGTANEKQLNRDKVHILEYDLDFDTFNLVPVPCQPAKEVFKESIFARKELNVVNTKEVLDNLVFTSNEGIYDVLDRAEQSDNIKAIVEEYLQAAGIFRTN